MGHLESVYCDGFSFATNLNLETFGTMLDDLERTFVRALWEGVVGVTANKHEFCMLELFGNRGWCSSMTRSGYRGK